VHLPAPHPDPPADLHGHRLPLAETPGPWIRSHSIRHGPLYFGTSGFNRFDAPDHQYGVLYAAVDFHGAFIETFGRELGHHAIDPIALQERALAEVKASRPLRLVDLTGPGLSQIGADSRLTASDYAVSQPWALALHEHPDQPDGILYRSRHDPSRFCAAIFDRAAYALTATSLGSLADPNNALLLTDLIVS
jgi:hypothetical protein